MTELHRTALLSPCSRYRYRLGRRWGGDPAAAAAYIMLNPSTADAELDDPTIRRCVSFAQREGLDAIEVANLYAYRASKPRRLAEAAAAGTDVIGPDNAGHLRDVIAGAALVVFAWGGSITQAPDGAAQVEAVRKIAGADELGAWPLCLGHTQGGQPRHPLYVKGDTPLIAWGGP